MKVGKEKKECQPQENGRNFIVSLYSVRDRTRRDQNAKSVGIPGLFQICYAGTPGLLELSHAQYLESGSGVMIINLSACDNILLSWGPMINMLAPWSGRMVCVSTSRLRWDVYTVT